MWETDTAVISQLNVIQRKLILFSSYIFYEAYNSRKEKKKDNLKIDKH